jgi:hypothetical protein
VPDLTAPEDRQHLLGRRPEFDPRSAAYPIRALFPGNRLPLRAATTSRVWPTPALMDQSVRLDWPTDDHGWDPSSCTGYSRAHVLMAEPVGIQVDPLAAFALYRRAQQIDEWDDTPPGEGSSVLAAVKAAEELGYIDSYWWAETKAEVIAALLTIGPGVAGTWWTADMFTPDHRGFIRPTGNFEGGHAYCIGGYIAELNAFVIYQSWGEWSDITDPDVRGALIAAGLEPWLLPHVCLITTDDLWWLIQQQGEFCVSIDRAKVPHPIDPTPLPIPPDPQPAPQPSTPPGCFGGAPATRLRGWLRRAFTIPEGAPAAPDGGSGWDTPGITHPWWYR